MLGAFESTAAPGTLGSTTLAGADRFTALLNAGRTIAAATSVADVRQALVDAAPVVLEAAECHIFDAMDPHGEAGDELSRSLMRQAAMTGQVVTGPPARRGARSALCAPISRDGRVVAFLYATHRDIGERFGDEEERLAAFMAAVAGATLEHVAGSEARFRALVRNSHDLTVVTDPNGQILYVSPSITRLLGYAPAELTTLGPINLVHDDDLEPMLVAFRLVRFSPAAHPTIEVRAQHHDGSWRWLEVTMSNLLSDKSVRGLVLNIREITDRKRAELALAQATEQFRSSFENAPIGMALTSIDPDAPGRWLRVNQALADMLGYPRAELEGRTFEQFTHPDTRAADEEALSQLRTGGTTSFTTVKRYRHADGHWIWVHLQTSIVAGDDGPRDYVISQMLDITERRAAEERLTFLALHDPLTGLANRRLLFDRLAVALARAERSGRLVAVLYVDIDGFKGINDEWGHDVGDQLLLQVSGRLRELTRDADTLARLGGDEFVLVAEELSEVTQAQLIAARIADSLRQPYDLPGAGLVAMSASVGVGLAGPGADADAVVRRADAAMYEAKERRRKPA
jgi:diguanylate cyclase (GGDEF)-like protein/PAS domain S-box-containing protein